MLLQALRPHPFPVAFGVARWGGLPKYDMIDSTSFSFLRSQARNIKYLNSMSFITEAFFPYVMYIPNIVFFHSEEVFVRQRGKAH